MANKANIDISAICRTGLAGVPLIGGPLAQAWSEWDGKQKHKRVEAALYALQRRLEAEAVPLNPARLTEEHFQFFSESMHRLEVESRATKRKRFISLLAGYWTGTVPKYDAATEFLYAIDRLSDEHIYILRQLRDTSSYPSFKELHHLIDPKESNPESGDRMIAIFNVLSGDYGFIHRSWTLGSKGKGNGLILGTKGLSPEGIARSCKHAITNKGTRFLKSIEEDTQQSVPGYPPQGVGSPDP